MFLIATTKDGKAVAIPRERICCIEEAQEKRKAGDLRINAVVTADFGGGKICPIDLQENFHALLNSFGIEASEQPKE
jgi:hypothetical protein